MVKYHELDGEIVVYDYIDYALPVGSTGVIEAYNATPLSFRDRVCWARLDPINSHYLKLVESDHRISGRHVEDSLCRECRKLPAYYLRKCFNCTNFFIKDFFDSRYCRFIPFCWNCLPQLPWSSCPDHPDRINWDNQLPLGVNPKTFTQEELDSFDPFSFDLFAES